MTEKVGEYTLQVTGDQVTISYPNLRTGLQDTVKVLDLKTGGLYRAQEQFDEIVDKFRKAQARKRVK